MYSPSIKNLIIALKKLPSVGQHTAERFVLHWLKSGKKEVTELMLALRDLIEKVKSCEVCWDFSESSPCAICSDTKRDHTTICVVAEPADLMVIEQTGIYRGVYHVLRELVDVGDEESLSRMKSKELFARLSLRGATKERRSNLPDADNNSAIHEIILALNPDLKGETTMLYLERKLKELDLPQTGSRLAVGTNLKITRLARGLPLGADLRYADEITLQSAIRNRTGK